MKIRSCSDRAIWACSAETEILVVLYSPYFRIRCRLKLQQIMSDNPKQTPPASVWSDLYPPRPVLQPLCFQTRTLVGKRTS